MPLVKQLSRIEALNGVIVSKETGPPVNIADKLQMSPSTVKKVIHEMKSMGAPIAYCRCTDSYVYVYKTQLNIGYKKVKGKR
ncbi:hypothetical protein [Algivirga pacifica]|uniref:Helix-turn-helix type 11 domain-containing protein n=1 Tax=Algivirga pacifica TaxID=1162670 RepID=A0ABP9DKP8_9BACT